MSNRELPYMPWWPQDFLTATAHWTCAERGAYAALLMYEWILDGLPNDAAELGLLCNTPPDVFQQLWRRVGRKFVADGAQLRNKRLEEHRVNAMRLYAARARGAQQTNAQRAAKRNGQRVAQHNGQRNAQRPLSVTPSVTLSATPSGTHPNPNSYPNPNPEENPPSPPFTLSATLSDPSPTEPPNAAWRDIPGLNLDIFEAYLTHIDSLVQMGRLRAPLAPHSCLAQAKWLAGQGGANRQQEIVTRAIRHGWKTLERAETRPGRRSFDDLHQD